MLDDARVRKTLVASGLLTPEEVTEIEVIAFRRGLSFYRTAVELDRVQETAAVSHVAGALGVPSVSLEKFTAKPKLMDVLPLDLVRGYRVLPVGLKPRDGELTLFVAMDDPQDLDALEAVSQHCYHPVVPLLAGPIDLDRALERVYPDPLLDGPGAPPLSPPPPPFTPRSHTARQDIFANVLDDLDHAAASDMLSALSMLDDIPRNRHDEVTSPSGFPAAEVPPIAQVAERSASNTESNYGRTHLAGPGRDPSASGFQHAGPASSSLGISLASGDPLAAALARVLIAKGILTNAELEEALEE